ncbi:dCTP deaminase [Streptomyces luomodiensis]|uniref:dCTP deaminase n=1 Tax=Streptomyces luomodiensis TaxID=3026192 RepID=A0ABY9UYF6_9ACTN|nr:dCTP deaminase [Streptomyces sp. SCA4-21]WNE95500.1 dCTP deaminase [Streptomyces sp. SCA4-21]
MILTGNEIQRQISDGNITISPFSPGNINPNSYNFTLGDTLIWYPEEILHVTRPNRVVEEKIDESGFVLEPDRIYLGHTVEVMGSDRYVPIIRARSSIARLGLFIHVTADLIDIGSINQWTLQLHAVQPIRVYPGMLIGQVTFWCVEGDIELYRGKYQGSKGPYPSMIHLDGPSTE